VSDETAPTGVADWCNDWDHADPAWAADPFSIWSDLRGACPVARTDRYGGAWLVTTAALVDEVTHDPGRFSSRDIAIRPPGTVNEKPPMTSDPPVHGEARRLFLRPFAPKAVASMEVDLRDYCRQLIRAIGGRRHFDAVVEFTRHVPSRVIATLLALPEEDTEQFRQWVRAIMEDGHVDAAAREQAVAELKAYLAPRLQARRLAPTDDLLTAVVQAELGGAPLSDDVALGVAYLLVVAGIDTTWSALGSMLWHLGTHPHDLAPLVADRGLVPAAVEELLRLYAPVSVGRVATVDTTLGDRAIKAGERVLVPFGAANRDPALFDRPDDMLLDREVSHHAAFGLGIHRCLGSNLARLELRVALEEWLEAFPSFRITDPGSITWTLGHVRGPHALPVEIGHR
jgi:hypothetical protein